MNWAPRNHLARQGRLCRLSLIVAITLGVTRISSGQQVATPTFAPNGGSFPIEKNGTVTCATSGATINYTTNGVTPTTSDRTVASGGTVLADRPLTLEANAWKSGMTTSATATAAFTITGKLAGGGNHSVGMRSEGTVWTWGSNSNGQLGIGSSDSSTHTIPLQVKLNSTTFLTGIALVGAGTSHSLAIKSSDGSVYGWGSDSAGQLGDNSTATQQVYPVQAKTTATGNPILIGITDIAGGAAHTIALKSDGTVWTWGSNSSGQLGNGGTTSRKLADQVKTSNSVFLTGVAAISAGDNFSVAVKTDGTVWAWGDNSSGQIGIGSTQTQKYAVQVTLSGGGALTGVKRVECGSTHVIAVKTDGTVWSWGNNTNGQLGNGTTTQAKNPVQVKINSTTFFTGANAVAAGTSHSAILKTDGSVYACGLNTSGQLSINSNTQQLYPTQSVSSAGPVLANIVDFACGGNHTLVTKNDGTVSGCGLNSSGQAGYPTTTTNPTACTPIANFLIISALADPDGDGLLTWRERELGTNPNVADTDADGMPDGWEVNNGLNPLVNDASADSDGDGFTNLYEYQHGTNPNDYYNGAAFNLDIFSGDGQQASSTSWLPQPLVVKVTNTAGTPLSNAPVTFSVTQSGGAISTVSGGTTYSSLLCHTDAAGKAQVYYQTPSTQRLAYITAQSGVGQSIKQVSFTVSTLNVSFPFVGLSTWLRADTGVVKDGNNAISNWSDSTGNGNNATQNSTSVQPLYVGSVINGKPIVRFDGIGTSLNFPNFASGFGAGEAFVVLKSTKSQPGPNTLWLMGDDYIWTPSMYPQDDGTIYETFGARTQTLTGKPSQALDQFHLYNVSSKASEFVTRINGREHFRKASNTVFFPSAPMLGGGVYGNHRFKGDIAEVLIFNRVLSQDERNSVDLYLNQKYLFIGSAPSVPTQFHATALNQTQVSLSWINAVSNAATFNDVQRRTGAGSFATIATVVNGMSYIDSTASSGTQYTYRIVARNDAGSAAASAEVTVTTPTSGTLLPVSDIKLWLKADEGVSRDHANVWTDSSGGQSDGIQVTPSYQPQVVENAVNGKPVVRFDGVGTYLGFPDFASALSQGEVFVVVKSTGTQVDTNTMWMMGDDYIWGPQQYPQSDGTIYENFGTRNGKATGLPIQALNQFNLYNVSSKAGEFITRFNGQQQYQTASNTVFFPSAPMLGGGVYGRHRFGGDIAEVIIFNRALSQLERDRVGYYLADKYVIDGYDLDGDGLTNAQELAAGTDPRNADTDGDGMPDGWEVNHGLNPLVNDAALDPDGDGFTNLQEYQNGTDPQDFYNIASLGCKLWLKSGAGVTKDVNNNISAWADQSGNNFQATQSNTGNKPLWVASGAGALPAVYLDGGNFNPHFFNLPDVMSGVTAGELFVVLKSQGDQNAPHDFMRFGTPGSGLYPYQGHIEDQFGSTTTKQVGTPSQPLTSYHLYNTTSQPGEWTARVNGSVQYTTTNNTVSFNTAPTIGGTFYGFQGYMAEILVFNHALTATERTTVQNYLVSKYNGVLIAAAPTNLAVAPQTPTQAGLNWQSQGGVTIKVERKTGSAGTYSQIGTVSSGISIYNDSGLSPGTQYFYRIRASNFAGDSGYSSEVSITTPASGATLPMTGLKLWLRADFGVVKDANNLVSKWTDQSANLNNATQTTASLQPTFVSNAMNALPVMHFDGQGRLLGVPGFLSSATAAEGFIVIRAPSEYSVNGGVWSFGWNVPGGCGHGTRYPTDQGQILDDFGSGIAYYSGPVGVARLDEPHVYNAVSSSSEWTSRINGDVQFTTTSNTVAFSPEPAIGASGWQPFYDRNYYTGDIAEVLVFDHALTQTERDAVVSYLHDKYGLGDSDGDGLPDWKEREIGTDPYNADTNGDGVSDGVEYFAGLDPANMDMDGDGLTNAQELAMGTNPFSADTDGDGVPDNQDAYPLDPSRWQAPGPDPNDHTPPVITLIEPADAVLLP